MRGVFVGNTMKNLHKKTKILALKALNSANSLLKHTSAYAMAFTLALNVVSASIPEETGQPLHMQDSIFQTSLVSEINGPIYTKEVVVDITAYSSTEDQTDSTPFIAASGKHVYDGMIAANFLPFGTQVKIPELFGDKIFIVQDRMNRRFTNRVDIWFPNRQEAIKFGIQKAKIVAYL